MSSSFWLLTSRTQGIRADPLRAGIGLLDRLAGFDDTFIAEEARWALNQTAWQRRIGT